MNTHEAIKILRNTAWLGTNEDREKTEQAIEVVAEALDQEPSRATGKWITEEGSYETICNKCKCEAFDKDGEYFKSDYCPNCGARMESDDE